MPFVLYSIIRIRILNRMIVFDKLMEKSTASEILTYTLDYWQYWRAYFLWRVYPYIYDFIF